MPFILLLESVQYRSTQSPTYRLGKIICALDLIGYFGLMQWVADLDLVSPCLALLDVSRAELPPSDPVSRSWPETFLAEKFQESVLVTLKQLRLQSRSLTPLLVAHLFWCCAVLRELRR